jgi:hypothetical protein
MTGISRFKKSFEVANDCLNRLSESMDQVCDYIFNIEPYSYPPRRIINISFFFLFINISNRNFITIEI